jgi:hypothetical protein
MQPLNRSRTAFRNLVSLYLVCSGGNQVASIFRELMASFSLLNLQCVTMLGGKKRPEEQAYDPVSQRPAYAILLDTRSFWPPFTW